jgi:Sec-independent protein translocase protein TatA
LDPRWSHPLNIGEIILVLIIALIVIPPDHLPEVMRALGKILRELRLASNTVVRELSGALEEPEYLRQSPHAQDKAADNHDSVESVSETPLGPPAQP